MGSATSLRALDAAYKPFPTFAEWTSRTSVETGRWDRYKSALESKPASASDTFRRAREVVKRAAALDTGAIEGLYEVDRGFTFTVALETAAWEVKLAEKGGNVRSLFEAQMHAYEFVLDLATKAEPISEAAIRVLHEVVCDAQLTYRVMTAVGPQEQELVKGRYKVLPNHVRTRDGVDHSYAPVDVTPEEMARLVLEMHSEAFLAAHPIIQAAYAHYGLVVIHPFADGNGRVARALASAFTYRATSMPIMILSEHKDSYLDALEAADTGKFQSFVDFMLARSLDTMTVVEESFRGVHVPTPKEGAAAIQRLYITRSGYTQDQVDRAAYDLIELLQSEVSKVMISNGNASFRGQASNLVMGSHTLALDASHRLPSGAERDLRLLRIEFSSSPPAHARVFRKYAVSVPIDAAGDDDIQLIQVFDEVPPHLLGLHEAGHRVESPMRAEVELSARIEELLPSLSGVLQLRVGMFASRIIGEMLDELKKLAEESLKGRKP